MPEEITDPSPGPKLDLLPYQRQTLEYLKDREADLWAWFSSTDKRAEMAETMRLELLKSAYRLERADHVAVYEMADTAAAALGITTPPTVYQSQSSAAAMNAYLAAIPGEAHVVFEGPVLSTLTPSELLSVFAHELSHHLMWQIEEGDLQVADQLLSAMAMNPDARPSHIESARVFRLYLEGLADRGSLHAQPDPVVATSALLKIQTGLTDARAESYLRQAEEILSRPSESTEELTHPEAFIRSKALALWTAAGREAEAEIAQLFEGPLRMDRLTFLGQSRVSDLTRGLLQLFMAPAFETDVLTAHCRLFFPDFSRGVIETPALEAELGKADASVRRYACYVLLDLGTVDPEIGDDTLRAALACARSVGIAELFLEIATEELKLTKKAITRLRRDADVHALKVPPLPDKPGGTAP